MALIYEFFSKDYLTNGHKAPKADIQQDWKATNIAEKDGITTMEFHRKKDTSDTVGDNVIGVGIILVTSLGQISWQ